MPLIAIGYQCHMMLTVSSMAPFHFLAEDDEKEMQHNIFGHVMPLISVSCDANGSNDNTTAYV